MGKNGLIVNVVPISLHSALLYGIKTTLFAWRTYGLKTSYVHDVHDVHMSNTEVPLSLRYSEIDNTITRYNLS